jgi:NTP pyrophosphatase (non-canonical NTP hydrolase)
MTAKPEGVLEYLARECMEDTERWFPSTNHVPFMVLAMTGEVGEVANWVKKIERGTCTLEEVREALSEEVVDVFIYLLNIAGLLQIDLEEGYYAKRIKNEERFGGSHE